MERRGVSLIQHVSFSLTICCLLITQQCVSHNNIWLINIVVTIPYEVMGTLKVSMSILSYGLVFCRGV